MADVVGFQIFWTNRLAPLKMLPTQPGDNAAVRIRNQFDATSRSASGNTGGLGQCGVGCNHRGTGECGGIGFGEKFCPAQQAFAVQADFWV